MSGIATLLVAAGANGSERCADGDQARAIEAQRQSFNRAIEETDLDTIAGVLAEDVVLLTGTESVRLIGRDAQIALWREDFASPERLVYERQPECFIVSEGFPIAIEHGNWRGEQRTSTEAGIKPFAAGAYSAKWRHDGTDWRLEAEVYMTEECSASICSENEPGQ